LAACDEKRFNVLLTLRVKDRHAERDEYGTAKEEQMQRQQVMPTACRSEGLADILERVLDKGVVIAGDIRIKLCDIELLTIQIRLLVASVDKAREMGLTWWWQSPQPQQPLATTETTGRI
jgi:hypothetical protein